MKRGLKYLITVILSVVLLIGCDSKNLDTIKEETLRVKILSDKSSFYQNEEWFKFTPILEGDTDNELQYRWILENNQEFEGFYIPENGPQKEIINSGEAVKFVVSAEVSYIDGAYSEFVVKLQVEEKDSSKVLAADEIIVENHAGYYKLQETTETSNNGPMPLLKNIEEIITTVYEQLTDVEKAMLKDNGKDAQVYKIILRKDLGRINDESYIGKEVYLIDFPGEGLSIPNNKIVFASMEEYKILGYGYVD